MKKDVVKYSKFIKWFNREYDEAYRNGFTENFMHIVNRRLKNIRFK